jgi:hypothetical protein
MEQLQQLILNTLEEKGSIADTRTLGDRDDQGFKTSESQMAVQAALSSLESRHVRKCAIHVNLAIPIPIPLSDVRIQKA